MPANQLNKKISHFKNFTKSNVKIKAKSSAQSPTLIKNKSGLQALSFNGKQSYSVNELKAQSFFIVASKDSNCPKDACFINSKDNSFSRGKTGTIFNADTAPEFIHKSEVRVNQKTVDAFNTPFPEGPFVFHIDMKSAQSLDILGASSPSGQFWYGEISELIFFDDSLTIEQRNSIENNLMEKWLLNK